MKLKLITHSYSEGINILSKMVVNGDEKIEDIRCLYKIDNSNIMYFLTAFDFIDLDLSIDKIKMFRLYQMIKN